MVTASHNPKEDNGFKLYWSNGAQIIPPHDEGIAAAIEANLKPWTTYDTTQDHILSHPNFQNVTDSVASVYFENLRALSACPGADAQRIRVAYTGTHTHRRA